MVWMCCGRLVYAGLFWRRVVSEGERGVVTWRVRRIISSDISCGRGVSMALGILLLRGRDSRFSSVRGSLVRASLRIRVFAASNWRRWSSCILSAYNLRWEGVFIGEADGSSSISLVLCAIVFRASVLV